MESFSLPGKEVALLPIPLPIPDAAYKTGEASPPNPIPHEVQCRKIRETELARLRIRSTINTFSHLMYPSPGSLNPAYFRVATTAWHPEKCVNPLSVAR